MNEAKNNQQPEGIAPVRSTDLLGVRVMFTEDWHTQPIGQPVVSWEDAELMANKIQKAIKLFQYLHDNCLASDITAHDAITTCSICRLIAELKAPNDQALRSVPKADVERKKDSGI